MNYRLLFIPLLLSHIPAYCTIEVRYSTKLPDVAVYFQPSWKTILAAGVVGLTAGAIATYALTKDVQTERLFDEANSYAYELNARYGNLTQYGSVGSYGFETSYKRFIVQMHAYDQFPFIVEALYLQNMISKLHHTARSLNQTRTKAHSRLNQLSYQIMLDTSYERNYLNSIIETCTVLHTCMLEWQRFCENDLLSLLVMMPEYATEYNLKYGNWRSYEIDVRAPQSISVSFTY